MGFDLLGIRQWKIIFTWKCKCHCSVSNSLRPHDCSPSVSSGHGIFQQEYWSELPFPSPGDHPDSRIEPGSPTLQADSLPSDLSGKSSVHIESSSKQDRPCLCGFTGMRGYPPEQEPLGKVPSAGRGHLAGQVGQSRSCFKGSGGPVD